MKFVIFKGEDKGKEIILSRRIEANIKRGTIIECANGGAPYIESQIPARKKGRNRNIFYCWIIFRNNRWLISEKRLDGEDGIIVTLVNMKLLPGKGDKIKIIQSFCGTAFAEVTPS